jgi:hypothetical protein
MKILLKSSLIKYSMFFLLNLGIQGGLCGIALPVYAYNEHAHHWIIYKAIRYLEEQENPIASEFPLLVAPPPENYIKWLYDGTDYADNQMAINEHEAAWQLDCEWEYGIGNQKHSCDTIHHYGHMGVIETWGGIDAAYTGEFAAPYYAEVLFEQAINFWPAGIEPKLSDLYTSRDAGRIVTPTSSTDLGRTWVGGLPFCEEFVSHLAGDYVNINDACPKWPPWASRDHSHIMLRYKTSIESERSAMIYLGWAIHMIEDLTVFHHAKNSASESHSKYEDKIDELLGKGWNDPNQFHHLPVSETESYKYSDQPTIPNYSDKIHEWTIKDFALEARRIGANGGPWASTVTSEHILDAAIKLVAAVIEKYFTCDLRSLPYPWIVPKTCVCKGSQTASTNVVVPNGVVLIIPDGAELDIDFTNNYLRVEKGGGVLIRKGGKLH